VERFNVGRRLIDFPAVLPGAPEDAAVVRAEALRPQLVHWVIAEQDGVPMQPNAPAERLPRRERLAARSSLRTLSA